MYFLYPFIHQWTFSCFHVSAAVNMLQWTGRWSTFFKKSFLFLYDNVCQIDRQDSNSKMLEKQGGSNRLVRGSLLFLTFLPPTHGADPVSFFPMRSQYNCRTKSPLTSPPAPLTWDLDYLNFCSVTAKGVCVNPTHSSILLGTFDQKLGLGHNTY